MAPKHSARDRWRIAVTAWPLTLAQFKVAIALSEFMDFNTLQGARPGTALLVERTQLAERTVKAALRDLRALHLIERVRQGGWAGGVFSASEYKGSVPAAMTPRRTAAEARAEAAERRAARGEADDTPVAVDGEYLLSPEERRARREQRREET